MQNSVFVLDTDKQPLSPCRPSVARKLLRDGKAAVYRRYPFTLILKRAVDAENLPPVTIKLDPGSKTTGIVLVQESQVIFAAELTHRGQAIKDALEKRRALRRNRRHRKTRYRAARFDNRTRPKGWLPPSIKSRIDNVQSWFIKLYKLAPIRAIAVELVKFDTQLMQDAEVSGVGYQQGELQGYEVREYLLEKFERKCAYCGKKDVPFEIEHIHPKSRGGSDRVSNLTLACHECNQAKSNQTAAEFGYPDVQKIAKAPLRDTAAVNAARWELYRRLQGTGLPVEVGTGGRTKFNRTQGRTQRVPAFGCGPGYPKTHWIDAACVGASGQDVLLCPDLKPLSITASGRGNRRMVNVDRYGFPRGKPKQLKRVHGFQTGDIVKAVVPNGKYRGIYWGKVNVRTNGNFKINGIDINWKHCIAIWRSDGYCYGNSA